MTTQKTLTALVVHTALMLSLGLIPVTPASAFTCLLDTNNDGNADTNVDTDAGADTGGNSFRLACGPSATATGGNATANHATALGFSADATATYTTAVGQGANARSTGATAVGRGTNIFVTDSPAAIAIGNESEVGAPGAIAIGGDRDGDFVGAQALAPGAIALGADVVADIADNMFVGVPVRVVPPSVGVSEKVLMRLENNGGVNFKLNDTSGGDGEWTFRTGSQGSKFVIGKTGSGVQEFQVFSGGNVTIAGTLTQSSSRTNKENIETINHRQVQQLHVEQTRVATLEHTVAQLLSRHTPSFTTAVLVP